MTHAPCCSISTSDNIFLSWWCKVAFQFATYCLVGVNLFYPYQAHAFLQDASPPPSSENVRVLSEGHTYSGATDQIYHFQVRSDSTVMLSTRDPGGTSLVMPADFFQVVSERISARLFESYASQNQLDVGLKDRALHLSLIQRYDLLLLSGAGIGFTLLVGLSAWLGVRLRRSRRDQKTLRMRYQALQEGEERERRRLAREIHDGPVQALHGLHLQMVGTSMSQHAETAAGGDGENPSLNMDPSSQLSTDLMNVARELRAISEGLHPASLERFGLVAALRSHARHLKSHSASSQQDAAPTVRAEGPDEPFGLSDTQRLALYRMGQEAITNAIHHASATTIEVEAWQEDQTVHLVVSDDGCGFDTDSRVSEKPHSAPDSNGLGLIGLKERATMIGSSITIDSTCGEGTTVSIVC